MKKIFTEKVCLITAQLNHLKGPEETQKEPEEPQKEPEEPQKEQEDEEELVIVNKGNEDENITVEIEDKEGKKKIKKVVGMEMIISNNRYIYRFLILILPITINK